MLNKQLDILKIEAQEDFPSVYCNAIEGIIWLKGRSTHEDPLEVYQKLFGWLEEYSKHPSNRTIVNVHLEYFNTSSSKCLLDAFKILEKIHLKNSSVVINWYHKANDEDLKEAGMDYSDLVKVPIKLITI